MASQPAPKSKSTVQAFLEEQIATGVLTPGDKLPTERTLSAQFGLSRNSVRNALRVLEERGKITRMIGRGTFVTGRQPKIQSANSICPDASPAEVMEVRIMLEPAVAEILVTRANGADLDYMATCLEKSEAARSWNDFEKWDAALHATMIRATRNQFLIEIFERIDIARTQTEWGKLKKASLTDERRKAYQYQHREIVDALRERDGRRARSMLEKHLLHVRRNLLGY